MARPKRSAQWSNLPSDLLEKISHHHLGTHLDFLRFRAICSSWRRYSTPPLRSPLLPSKLPYPIDLGNFKTENYQSNQQTQPTPCGHYRLTQSIVYLVQPTKMKNPKKPKKMKKASSTTSGATSWLVKLQETEDGSNKFRVLSPVSDRQIKNVGVEVNLLDFRFIENSKAYYLEYVKPSQSDQLAVKHSDGPEKILFFPGINDEYAVVALNFSRLYYVKNGDEKWTKFNFAIQDIVIYNGRLHSVDSLGYTTIYDSSFGNPTLISDYWESGRGSKTALLEYCGRLLSVDIKLDSDSCTFDVDPDDGVVQVSGGTNFRTAVQMKFYFLNEEKHVWEIENNLGDRIMFLGNDCSYSVSATHFEGCKGCKGNVVYHADEGIVLQFEKEKPELQYSYGCEDEFIDGQHIGDDKPCDDHEEVGPTFWFDSDSSDDGFPCYRRKAYSNVIGASDHVLRGLHGQNIGVFDVETNKLGSLLMFRKGASIFYPPPAWLKN